MRFDDIRFNTYIGKKSDYCAAGGVHEFADFPKPLLPQVAELLAVGFLDGLVETGEKVEPFRRDPCHHHAPVLRFPATGNQAPLLQTVEKPGDIGIPRNHAGGDLAAGQPFQHPTKDSQHVVLVGRHVFGLQNEDQAPRQHVGRAQHFQENRFLGAALPSSTPGLIARLHLRYDYSRYNDICQGGFLGR